MRDETPAPPRLPRWMTRQGEPLPDERVRLRVAAFIYGNIIVLTTVASTSRGSIDDGAGNLIVLATTVTTYLAHITAHTVAHQIGRAPGQDRASLLQYMRDALPIVSAGGAVSLILLLGTLDQVPTTLAQFAAGIFIAVRLALLGVKVERTAQRRATPQAVISGLLLAAASLLVVALKLVFAY